jgi:hypothetical protein
MQMGDRIMVSHAGQKAWCEVKAFNANGYVLVNGSPLFGDLVCHMADYDPSNKEKPIEGVIVSEAPAGLFSEISSSDLLKQQLGEVAALKAQLDAALKNVNAQAASVKP